MEKVYSLQTIEQQVQNLKNQGLKSKTSKAKYHQAKAALNKIYTENKNRIMQFENTNYSHLAHYDSRKLNKKLYDKVGWDYSYTKLKNK